MESGITINKAGIYTSNVLSEKFADDDSILSWIKDSVYYISQIGIIKGIRNNKFGVKNNATREQSILILLRGADSLIK